MQPNTLKSKIDSLLRPQLDTVEDISTRIVDFTDFALRYPRAKSVELYTDFLKESKSLRKKSSKRIRATYRTLSYQTDFIQQKFDIAVYGKKLLAFIQRYGIRILLGILIIDAVLLLFFFLYLQKPLSASQKSVMHSHLVFQKAYADDMPNGGESTSLEFGELTSHLSSLGFIVSSANQTRKEGLSVPGTLLTTSSDTVLVFEYPSQKKASGEALSLSQSYAKNPNDMWADQVHIYTKGSLVIYYLGAKPAITEALTKYAGISLINQEHDEPETIS